MDFISVPHSISIHSLRVEGDQFLSISKPSYIPFQSTPSVWRETRVRFSPLYISNVFQSTPSVWRETDENPAGTESGAGISIHSLRVEGDVRFPSGVPSRDNISIHSLRVEGDFSTRFAGRVHFRFQSTPSVWRETASASMIAFQIADFNPLPPCGGRQSICFLHNEGKDFNPLPPCGGRHFYNVSQITIIWISIHSLRVEGDKELSGVQIFFSYFNPLPPCGGRLHTEGDSKIAQLSA